MMFSTLKFKNYQKIRLQNLVEDVLIMEGKHTPRFPQT